MSGAILTCTADLVDGACPANAQQWVASSSFDPFALPSAAELSNAFNAAISAFFVPTMTVLIVALGVRWLLEQVS